MKALSFARHCDKCRQFRSIPITPETTRLECPNCRHPWGEITNKEDIFDRCPSCGCRQFYLSKNFSQVFGCLTVLIAIVLVPLTYGLSLPIFALLDWYLYKKVATIINCYRCGSEFYGWDNDKRFKPFLHHIGLKYDKYR